jgi:hypothetical protein
MSSERAPSGLGLVLVCGISLVAVAGFLANNDLKKQKASLEKKLSQFPSEVQEMKRIEVDGDERNTREYMVRVPTGPLGDENHTKWIYLKEFNPYNSSISSNNIDTNLVEKVEDGQ